MTHTYCMNCGRRLIEKWRPLIDGATMKIVTDADGHNVMTSVLNCEPCNKSVYECACQQTLEYRQVLALEELNKNWHNGLRVWGQ